LPAGEEATGGPGPDIANRPPDRLTDDLGFGDILLRCHAFDGGLQIIR
jgi:hypothetical protein